MCIRDSSICGYNNKIKIPKDYKADAYIYNRSSSWGWATWKDRWIRQLIAKGFAIYIYDYKFDDLSTICLLYTSPIQLPPTNEYYPNHAFPSPANVNTMG